LMVVASVLLEGRIDADVGFHQLGVRCATGRD
jgi:hypothetical protein